MENNNKYDYSTFEEVFSQIGYAFEYQYPCYLEYDSERGVSLFSIYKLTIISDGRMEYKGNYETYDPKLWPRIELLAKVMTNDPMINLLYKNE